MRGPESISWPIFVFLNPQEAKQKEEEERKRKETEEFARIEREEIERKAREEAEKQKIETAEKLRKEEKEREERRKRVEAIMARTRKGGNPGNTPNRVGCGHSCPPKVWF